MNALTQKRYDQAAPVNGKAVKHDCPYCRGSGGYSDPAGRFDEERGKVSVLTVCECSLDDDPCSLERSEFMARAYADYMMDGYSDVKNMADFMASPSGKEAYQSALESYPLPKPVDQFKSTFANWGPMQ